MSTADIDALTPHALHVPLACVACNGCMSTGQSEEGFPLPPSGLEFGEKH